MDNQIMKENWFEIRCRISGEQFDKLTIKKPVVKKIPVEIWSEIKPDTAVPNDLLTFNILKYTMMPQDIRNSGGRTYLVTTVNNNVN